MMWLELFPSATKPRTEMATIVKLGSSLDDGI